MVPATQSRTDGMRELELGMTNFDHSIDDGLDEALRAEPARVFARYPGMNFHALVWYEDESFQAEVWTFRYVAGTVSARTLPELMELICSQWGRA